MKTKVINIVAFLTGSAVGSVVTWKLLKTKYARMAQEEIDSVKEVFSKKNTVLTNEVNKAHELLKANHENEESAYAKIVQDLGYALDARGGKEQEVEDKKVEEIENGPYVISPDSFDEMGYETVSLTYYEDGVLVYDSDEIVKNVDELIGPDALKSFGEYEDDSVFVRNDELQTDFEILKDMRNYSDVVSRHVNPRNDD